MSKPKVFGLETTIFFGGGIDMNRFNSEKVCLGMKWNEPVPAIETGDRVPGVFINSLGAEVIIWW